MTDRLDDLTRLARRMPLAARDDESLIEFARAGEAAGLSVPTLDHYPPLLYAAAISDAGDGVAYPYTGSEMASL